MPIYTFKLLPNWHFGKRKDYKRVNGLDYISIPTRSHLDHEIIFKKYNEEKE